MKTQMQIVQEAIARLENMSREEFVQSLVSAGLVDDEPPQHELFSHTILVGELIEIAAIPHVKRIHWHREDSSSALSFAF